MSHFLVVNEVGILNLDLNNTSLHDVNFEKDDPEVVSHVRLKACCNKFKQCKTFKDELS